MKNILILIGIIFLSINIFSSNKQYNDIEHEVDINEQLPENGKKIKRQMKQIYEIEDKSNSSVTNKDIDVTSNNIITKNSTTNYFTHLPQNDLSAAFYRYQSDQTKYESDLENNYYVPQGLSKDKDNNLLISLYYYNGSTIKNSIVIRYDVYYGLILNVYDLGMHGHVGGVGYYYQDFNWDNGYKEVELLFVQSENGNGIQIYTLDPDGNSDGNAVPYRYHSMYHTPSTLSTSYGYLWAAKWYDIPTSSGNHEMSGSKINFSFDSQTGEWEAYLGLIDREALIPNFVLYQPKEDIQGIYCASNPETENRLKFYFTSSGNQSFIYQAILVSNYSLTNNYQILTGEYYWESFYTPYESADWDNYDTIFRGRLLPYGGEGIVMINDELYMLNEGASDLYCDDWLFSYPDNLINCVSEVLQVNPIMWGNVPQKIFPSGSIIIKGSGLENFGEKVAIVYAQNKKGELYYTIGRFTCGSGSCKMYLKEPSVENPIGKQTTSYRDYAKVFIEDIKGLFFMNLNDYPSTLNSDDFHMDKIILRFDDIEDFYLGVEYDEEIIVDKEFGDTNTNLSTGDSEFLKIAFDVRLGDNDIGYLSAINNSYSTNSYWQPYYNIFNNLRTCYNTSNTWSTQRECNRDALDDMEDFIYYNRSGFLFSLNNYIDRLIDIF